MVEEELIIDEEFKNLIPELTPDEQVRLARSIIAEGCRDAIVVWDGTIVDGHNRYKICLANDITFEVKEVTFADREEAKAWIIGNQLSRRNLTPYDRGRLALQLEEILKSEARTKQISFLQQNQPSTVPPTLAQRTDTAVPPTLAGREITKGDTRDKLAKLAGVSHGTLDKIKQIEATATPKQKAELSSGKATVNKIHQEIKEQSKKADPMVRMWNAAEEEVREEIRKLGLKITASANNRYSGIQTLADELVQFIVGLDDCKERLSNIVDDVLSQN